MAKKDFAAAALDFEHEAGRKTLAVFKQSCQDTTEDAQKPKAKGGRMRVDTSFLRNSHVSGINGDYTTNGAEAYTATIGQLQLGDTYSGGWTANYAGYREFGANGQAPDFYMRGALQKFPSFVKKNADKIR